MEESNFTLEETKTSVEFIDQPNSSKVQILLFIG